MAIITPNTDLYLLKVPLEINALNQLDFENASSQYNYFNSLPKVTVDDFTYQRKDGTIRFPMQMDEIITYNYCMYRNTEYSDKWFYAYITNMEYINDNMTLISIKTDSWQTWQFNLNYKPCLIDREHTNDDTVGKNTLPEGLELGDFVINGDVTNFGAMSGTGDYVVILDVSMIENKGANQTLSYHWDTQPTNIPISSPVNGIPSGVIHLILGYNQYNQRVSGYYDPYKVTEVYNLAGLSDAIINCYMVPESLIDTSYIYGGLNITASYQGDTPETKTANNLAIFAGSSGAKSIGSRTFNRPTTLDGYTPKNNKMRCFPFCYFNLSNNAGSSVDFRYEDFSSNITFNLEGIVCPSGSIKAIPQNYKNISGNENAYDYSINGAKYPILSWKSDSYTNWLTQNAVNIKMERATVKRQFIGNVLSGFVENGVIGAGAEAISGVGSLLQLARNEWQAKSNANLSADTVGGNVAAGDIVWSKLRSNFTYLPMSIKAEYAKCCDEYLSAFGYKTNRVKLPNIRGRKNWNYVKTIGCYIEADIPQEDLAEIKTMFDNGITFWHNPATFADYSNNNDII